MRTPLLRWLPALFVAAMTAFAGTGALASTADHSKFKELQRDFASGPELTKACLSCHSKAAEQVMKTTHWTWEFENQATKQKLGKKHVLNNFCLAIEANQAYCTTCHIGYGWTGPDEKFDFTRQENVDCVVCHDTTGAYRKQAGLGGGVVTRAMEFPPGSGKMVKPVDLKTVAQKVGKTSRDTCGACHFYGGGGDGVKHGDLDSSMAAPDTALDVHMDPLGLDFKCATCHMTKGHAVPGSRYAPIGKDDKGRLVRGSNGDRNPSTCQSCHGNDPHPVARLNSHAAKIACQTCHIPAFARGGVATKMGWDWSTAGRKDQDGNSMTLRDDKNRIVYESRKGDFVLGENVVPEYRWFNGTVNYTLLTDKIDPTKVVNVNWIEGTPGDGKSLIWPFKVMRGKQPYDTENLTLVKVQTAGDNDTAYWKNQEWVKAITVGMEWAGQPFSGKYDFVATEMSWPITHMVAPKGETVGCTECHGRMSRLAGVPGIYMPGHSAQRWLDLLGWSAAGLTLLGVTGHGFVRLFSRGKGKKQ